MKQKKVPMRKCMGCNMMFPKKDLVRVVKAPDIKDEQGFVTEKGAVSLDLTGKKPGRGAYVCKNSDCLLKALKSKRIDRSLDVSVPPELFDEMEREMKENE
ncbi:MAG: RNase P modulator RnpM [Acutalibacteraceae bacterium]